LQVGGIYLIEVDEADRADSGSREVKSERRAEPARSDHEDLAGFETQLPVLTDLGQGQVPRIPAEL